MFCPKCSGHNREGNLFCFNCGTKLQSSENVSKENQQNVKSIEKKEGGGSNRPKNEVSYVSKERKQAEKDSSIRNYAMGNQTNPNSSGYYIDRPNVNVEQISKLKVMIIASLLPGWGLIKMNERTKGWIISLCFTLCIITFNILFIIIGLVLHVYHLYATRQLILSHNKAARENFISGNF